jgi:hypothetical protein
MSSQKVFEPEPATFGDVLVATFITGGNVERDPETGQTRLTEDGQRKLDSLIPPSEFLSPELMK